MRFAQIPAFILISFVTYGQSSKKCDDSILEKVSTERGVTEIIIKSFLLTLGQECSSNVEFSEWSNEILFQLLNNQTELTIKTIVDNQREIDMSVVLEYLASPINDSVDPKAVASKVGGVEFDERLKKEMLTRLLQQQ
jgi:hypothetical protein